MVSLRVMKKLLLIGAAFAALIAPAIAAEKPVRVYKGPVMATPVDTWTGFYVGGNVGYSWGQARTDIAGNGTIAFAAGIVAPPGGFVSNLGYTDSNRTRLDGVIGGGQIGYNIRLNRNFVIGIETDIQASGQRGNGSFADPFSTNLCSNATFTSCLQFNPLPGTALTSYQAKIGWFGTLRGRAGFLVTDQLLIYGTGGLAYGRVELSGVTATNAADVFPDVALPFISNVTAFGASRTNVGYSVGAGAEGSIWLPAKWRWKLEYLFLDLGSLNAAAPFSLAPPVGVIFTSPITGTIATHARFTDHILRVGLNYGF
jgi:outer membrane immunogenic protein